MGAKKMGATPMVLSVLQSSGNDRIAYSIGYMLLAYIDTGVV